MTLTFVYLFCLPVIIGSKSLSWKYSMGHRTAFTRSAITLPKVNRYGWNLEQCEPYIGNFPWQILAAIRSVATVWEAAKNCFFSVRQITHDFTTFPSDKFHDIWALQRRSVSPCKHSEQSFKDFTIRGRFFKNAKIAHKISRYCDFRPS